MQALRTSRSALCAAATVLTAVSASAQSALDVKTPAPAFAKTSETFAYDPTLGPPKTKDALPGSARSLKPDHSRMYYQDAADGTWARGASYKARFASDGVELVPFFGSKAPNDVPLSLDLVGVTVAGDALPFASDVAPKRNGDVIEFDRSAVIERYSASPKALEQSFVIPSLTQRGELKLYVAFDGEYATRGDGRSIEFANALGTVECHDAVVVDARGRRLELPLHVDGVSYEIDVPADFVQSAALPLVVDPIFTTFTVDNSTDDDFLADAAYDLATDTWRTVYQEQYSFSDIDVYTLAFDANGTPLALTGGYVDQTSERWAHPRIANNRYASMFAIVAECGPIGSREIRTQHVSAISQNFGWITTVAPVSAGEMLNPDIGGDPSPTASAAFLVVFERAYSASDHDIHARLLDAYGGPIGSVFHIDNTSNTLDEVPSVSKSDGLPPASFQNWTIAWQRLAQPGDHDIYGARVHWDGSLLDATFMITASAQNETNPSVSSPLDLGGTARPNLMACELQTAAFDHDIKMVLFAGTATKATADLSVMTHWQSLDQLEPHVDSDGRQFVVTYSESFGLGVPDYDIYGAYVGPIGNSLELSASFNALAIHGTLEENPCVAAAHSSGSTSSRYFCAWDDQVGADRDVLGVLLDGPQGGAITTLCESPSSPCPCGNSGASGHGCANSANPSGALLTVTGAPSVSQDTLTFHASGMPPTAPCLFFEGTTEVNGYLGLPFGDGRKCVGGMIVRFPLKGAINGATSYPQLGDASVSIAGHVPVIGGRRCYQAWYRDPASYCSNATFNLSNAISVDWTP